MNRWPGKRQTRQRGRSKDEKKLVVIAVEKVKGDKIGRAYPAIEHASGNCFEPFFAQHIDSDNIRVITDGWREYWPLESEYDLTQKLSQGGKSLSTKW